MLKEIISEKEGKGLFCDYSTLSAHQRKSLVKAQLRSFYLR